MILVFKIEIAFRVVMFTLSVYRFGQIRDYVGIRHDFAIKQE